MKRSFYNSIFIAAIALIWSAASLHAQEVTKRIAKNYKIADDTKISISNKFGDVVIRIWDKDEIDIKVEIEARGRNESRTQKILDAIEVNFTDHISAGLLSVKTVVGNTGNNASFSINYEISMPGENPLQLTNTFGSVFMGSYRGDLQLRVKYGQFMAENLANADLTIAFSSSRGEVEALSAGRLDLSYSKMTLDEVGDVRIESKFSDIDIEHAGNIKLEARYGDIDIGSVKSLDGELQFVGLDIAYLSDRLVLEGRYGDGIRIDKISKDFKEIDIESEFSTVRLNLQRGVATKLDFDLAFGNLKVDGENVTFTRVIKETTTSEYTGYMGNPQASSSIKVSTRYGNIRLEVD